MGDKGERFSMNSIQQLGRKKVAVGVGAALLLAASLITVGAAVSAQSGPTADCSNDNPIQFGTQFFGSADYDNHLLSSGPTELTFDYALPAGTYEIAAVSTDGYIGRELITQTEEQWFAQFVGADELCKPLLFGLGDELTTDVAVGRDGGDLVCARWKRVIKGQFSGAR